MSLFLFLLLFQSPEAPPYPEAEITNGVMRAKLLLPDPQRGYYRGTRFDWSGAISSLTWQGHEYFGQWFPKYDPKIHDAIMGPVEEYRTGDAGLGYDEAKSGDTFVRIGVGVVRKPEEKQYRTFFTYDIVDPGKWTVRTKKDRVEFIHELTDGKGYAYRYTKVVRLTKGKPEMVIEHTLANKGKRPIETAQYNHNFFMIDKRPTGPEFTVRFPFDLKATRNLQGLAEIRGKDLVYLKELQKGQSVFTELQGFGATASDYDIRIENAKAKAGVRIRGDQPLSKVVFWSISTTLCPEPYINLRAEPGKKVQWQFVYDFYELP